jgi:DNA invertase Pin-like site-specific DNA recombinase
LGQIGGVVGPRSPGGAGWTIAEFFIQGGVCGSLPLADRPEGERMLATVGKGDVIVVAKLDRAFRSAADALTVLEELKDQGVGLHLIDLGGDVIGNGVSKMVFTILAAVAEGERDRLRERIRDTKRHLASQSVFSGGSRPFGFDVVLGGEVRRLVPNAAEQAVIDRMKAMRQQGATLRAIGAPSLVMARSRCSASLSAPRGRRGGGDARRAWRSPGAAGGMASRNFWGKICARWVRRAGRLQSPELFQHC